MRAIESYIVEGRSAAIALLLNECFRGKNEYEVRTLVMSKPEVAKAIRKLQTAVEVAITIGQLKTNPQIAEALTELRNAMRQ